MGRTVGRGVEGEDGVEAERAGRDDHLGGVGGCWTAGTGPGWCQRGAMGKGYSTRDHMGERREEETERESSKQRAGKSLWLRALPTMSSPRTQVELGCCTEEKINPIESTCTPSLWPGAHPRRRAGRSPGRSGRSPSAGASGSGPSPPSPRPGSRSTPRAARGGAGVSALRVVALRCRLGRLLLRGMALPIETA